VKKRLVQIAGWILLALSLFYLGRTATIHFADIPLVEWSIPGIAAIIIAITVYVGTVFIWGASWVVLLRAVGEKRNLLFGVVVIGISQTAKYLPGNIAHHLGRIALAGHYGLNIGRVTLTMAVEMCWIVAASCACALLALALSKASTFSSITGVEVWHLIALMAAACALPFVAMSGIRRWGIPFSKMSVDHFGIQIANSTASLTVFLSHFVNFFLQGGLLMLLAQGLFNVPLESYWLATGVFAFAWVAGFFAPGVPAGLGVREAILATGLALDTNMGSAIALATGHRVVTVAGDVIVFGAAMLLRQLLSREEIRDQ
tara:strand:+ start:10533 stop:11480 length:948 start_codon:yes stop_codon:yes gene_type:complete